MMNYDSLQVFLPQYLSETDQKKLVQEIRNYTENPKYSNFFLGNQRFNGLLQGDGIAAGSLPISDATSRTFRDDVPGVLLTNTCDMSLDNPRSTSLNLSYAPVFDLQKYQKVLAHKKGQDYAKRTCDDIRQQIFTSYFYLPANSGLGYEGFVHLDKTSNCLNSATRSGETIAKRRFSLNQFGHYLFLFKLSIHFTRIREGDIRGA